MFSTWLYISLCTTEADEARHAVRAIVDVSRYRNDALGITGALIWTGRRFAQFLEGPDAAVATVRASILRDVRHRDVQTLEQSSIPDRMFEGWSLAYAGVASYFDRQLERISAQAANEPALSVAELKSLLIELERGGRRQGA